MSGRSNTSTGYQSLSYLTTGEDNTASGVLAGRFAVTSNRSVFQGMQAGRQSVDIDDGVNVGHQAGRWNTNGDFSTYIGAYSGPFGTILDDTNTATADTDSTIVLTNPTGASVGSYVTLVPDVGYIAGITGVPTNSTWLVVHADTLKTPLPITLGLSGTLTNFKIQQGGTYTNSSAIGYFANVTKSNQIQLGNQNITEIEWGNGLLGWYRGSGTPEGVITANIGSIYSNTNGGANITTYVKETGNGTNTGWLATNTTVPVTGTGTVNKIPKWSAGGTDIEDSRIVDNGTNIGLGTAIPPANYLTLDQSVTTGPKISLYNGLGYGIGISGSDLDMYSSVNHRFYTGSTSTTQGTEIASLLGTGQMVLNSYGSGTYTGTAAKYLAVEADGDVIEVDLASGMDAVVSDRSYVDNTAALVDLVSGQVYYNTTSSTFVVLP